MYGTSDAGRNVHNEDPQLAEWLRQAGKKLNLRTHKVKGKVRCGVVWCVRYLLTRVSGNALSLDFGYTI